MNHPNIPKIKLAILACLDINGPQEVDRERWNGLEEFQDRWPEDFAAFRDRAISDLAQEGFIICSHGRIFLTRSLHESFVPTNIDLATAIRVGWLMNSLPESVPFDAFQPTPRDFGRFCEVAFKAIESWRNNESEIAALKKKLGDAKSEVKHLKDLEQQARQALNRRLKQDEEEKTMKVLATHKIANGTCELCGQTEKVIAEARIYCDGQVRDEFRKLGRP